MADPSGVAYDVEPTFCDLLQLHGGRLRSIEPTGRVLNRICIRGVHDSPISPSIAVVDSLAPGRVFRHGAYD